MYKIDEFLIILSCMAIIAKMGAPPAKPHCVVATKTALKFNIISAVSRTFLYSNA